ncbi:response regulator [Chryseolinea sp. T2]|uniref:response regulator n=1 Tax=Chryseolinea sp. T2 TaxID=3129255 RepID=UPI0030783F81
MTNDINILVVDDSEIDRYITIGLFSYLFKKVSFQEADNGEDALTILQDAGKQFPHLVIVDINMPVMNGFQFIKTYEQIFWKHHPDTFLYFVSSSCAADDVAKALQFSSVAGYLTKPFDLVKVRKLLMPFQISYVTRSKS